MKLASHLTQTDSKGILYLFDEPTTGLHFDDITKLLDAFDRLIKKGATLLIIEHNLEVIRHADWLIDLGAGWRRGRRSNRCRRNAGDRRGVRCVVDGQVPAADSERKVVPDGVGGTIAGNHSLTVAARIRVAKGRGSDTGFGLSHNGS